VLPAPFGAGFYQACITQQREKGWKIRYDELQFQMEKAMRKFCLIILLCLPISTTLAAERVFDIGIEQREVTSPGDVLRVVKGDTVILRWHSDEAVELHMHGYDIPLKVEANRLNEMRFNAEVSGRFPVTSHGFSGAHSDDHKALLYVEIYPE